MENIMTRKHPSYVIAMAVLAALSNLTVAQDKAELMGKLGRHSIAELTQYAIVEGLVAPRSAIA